MKKFIVVCALFLFSMFGFVSCAVDEPPGQVAVNELTPTETPETIPTAPPTYGYNGLNPERELQIIRAFDIWWAQNHDTRLSVDVIFGTQYFGTFAGREVVYMHVGIVFTDNTPGEIIAGLTFTYPHGGLGEDHSYMSEATGGVHLWLHDDGEFMCICVGYERGLLTAEDIGIIWERYNEW